MPRKDPHSGCVVMTFPEFIAGEAERENKEPHEIMDEVFGMLEEDDHKIESEWRDPANALEVLRKDYQEQFKEWQSFPADQPPPEPVGVLKVIAAHHHQGLRGSNGTFTALVRCADGKKRYAVYSTYYEVGTYIDPPDGGSEVSYYQRPRLTPVQRQILQERLAPNRSVHSHEWWRTVPKKTRLSLENKGLVAGSGNGYRLTPLGKLALGIMSEFL